MNIQDLFSTLTSTTTAYSAIGEWLDRQCSEHQTFLTELGSCMDSDFVSALADGWAMVVTDGEKVSGSMETTVVTAITVKAADVYANFKAGVETVVGKAVNTGADVTLKISTITRQIASAVAQIQTAVTAFSAMAKNKADSSISAMSEFVDEMKAKFSSYTTSMAAIGSNLIECLNSTSMAVADKINVVLTALGLRQANDNNMIGLPVYDISDVVSGLPVEVFVNKLVSYGAEAWPAIKSAVSIAVTKVTNALSNVLGYTASGLAKLFRVYSGASDSYYNNISTIATNEGPCFSDFRTTMHVSLNNESYTTVLSAANAALDSVDLTSEDTIEEAITKIASHLQMQFSDDADLVWTPKMHPTAITTRIWMVLRNIRSYSSFKGQSDSKRTAMTTIMNACALGGYKTYLLSGFLAIRSLMELYNNTFITTDNRFIDSLSMFQYSTFETPGSYVSMWKSDPSNVYIQFSWRPIDLGFLETKDSALRGKLVGNPMFSKYLDVDTGISEYDGSQVGELINLLVPDLTTYGWEEGVEKAYTDFEMVWMLKRAKLTTLWWLYFVAYSRELMNGATVSVANANAQAALVTFSKVIRRLSDITAYSDATHILPKYTIDAELLACYLTSNQYKVLPTNGTGVLISEVENPSEFLNMFEFMSSDNYFYSYYHTASLPRSAWKVMSTNVLITFIAGFFIMAGTVAVIASITAASLALKRKQQRLQAKADIYNFDIYDDATGSFNQDAWRTYRRSQFQANIIGGVLTILGKASSEVAEESGNYIAGMVTAYTEKSQANLQTGVTGEGGDNCTLGDLKTLITG